VQQVGGVRLRWASEQFRVPLEAEQGSPVRGLDRLNQAIVRPGGRDQAGASLGDCLVVAGVDLGAAAEGLRSQ
jgi:hypothetical protein